MKRISAKLRPSPSMAVALIALIVALSGSAYAAVTINGKNIKTGTITGNKLKKNTITGSEIDESKLGRVPSATRADLANQADNAVNAANAANAAKIGGASLGGLVQGGGHIYSNSVNALTEGNDIAALNIPGLGVLRFDCLGGGFSTPDFLNTSGTTLAVLGENHFVTTEGPIHKVEPSIPSLDNNSVASMVSRSTATGVFQAWNYIAGISATINFSSFACSYNAQAVVNK